MTWTQGCISVAAVGVAIMAIQTLRAAELPEPVAPQFCGVQLKSDNFTIATLDAVHAAGFRVVRRGFYWGSIEKEKGTYSFADYDAQMAHAKKLGLVVVGALFSHNKHYTSTPDETGFPTEAERKGFAAFAAAAAKHYQDQPVLWEIWNEPNVRTFWGKHGTHNTQQFADEYCALVKEVAPAMLKAVPDCFIMAGSVSNYWEPSYQWTEFCFKNGILKTGIRGWSVHPYGVKTPEEFAIGHKRTRDLLVKYGAPDMPMLNTERGFSAKETAEGWSGGSQDRALEYQAWNLVRQYMMDQLHDVKLTIWYELGGTEGFALTHQGEDRPAFGAAKTMMQELDGHKLVGRIDTGHPLDYVLLWQNSGGSRKLVAWTAPPAGESPDNAFPHEVQISGVTDGDIATVDVMGAKAVLKASGQSVRIKVTGAPLYLSVPGSATLTAKSIEPFVAPTAPAAQAPAGAADLKLFEASTTWKFEKNTGEGSFTLSKDAAGKPIGVMQYDFAASSSKNTPYVLASAPASIAQGATEVSILARSSVAQQLTFRLTDSTGQTLQYKTKIKGSGEWEAIRIPLTRKLEHWGGANDGKVHFPIKSMVFSVPRPSEEHKTGKVEYADAVAVTGDSATPAP